MPIDPVKTVVLTDSTADLPPHVLKEQNIKVIPMTITVDGRKYTDGFDLTTDSFYKLLEKISDAPTTDPPSVEQFTEIYGNLLSEYDQILSIHVSSRLSKTFSNAREAVVHGSKFFREVRMKNKRFHPYRVRVVDSQHVSGGLGIVVIRAAEALRQGHNFGEVYGAAEDMHKHVHYIFTLKDLKYMRRSNRVPAMSYVLAKMIDLKPIIEMDKGVLSSIDRVRGYEQAVEKILEHFNTHKAAQRNDRIIVVYAGHAALQQENLSLVRIVKAIRDRGFQVIESTVGPTIGTHCGPEAIGIAYYSA
ncbi:MAG: DegV family protein [Rhizobacter sp.]|nr:DegV family protein [Chlorobiales bacterium]